MVEGGQEVMEGGAADVSSWLLSRLPLALTGVKASDSRPPDTLTETAGAGAGAGAEGIIMGAEAAVAAAMLFVAMDATGLSREGASEDFLKAR